MTTTTMTFQESYGTLPLSTYRAVKMYRVSPADWDGILAVHGTDFFGVQNITHAEWVEIEAYIVSHSETGMYRPRFF